MFNWINKVIQIWNDLRVSKWWQCIFFLSDLTFISHFCSVALHPVVLKRTQTYRSRPGFWYWVVVSVPLLRLAINFPVTSIKRLFDLVHSKSTYSWAARSTFVPAHTNTTINRSAYAQSHTNQTKHTDFPKIKTPLTHTSQNLTAHKMQKTSNLTSDITGV